MLILNELLNSDLTFNQKQKKKKKKIKKILTYF